MMHHFSVTLRGGGPFWCHLDKERRCKKCFPEALLLFAFAYITFLGDEMAQAGHVGVRSFLPSDGTKRRKCGPYCLNTPAFSLSY